MMETTEIRLSSRPGSPLDAGQAGLRVGRQSGDVGVDPLHTKVPCPGLVSTRPRLMSHFTAPAAALLDIPTNGIYPMSLMSGFAHPVPGI